MSQTGWTPVDESASSASGWQPVDEQPKSQPITDTSTASPLTGIRSGSNATASVGPSKQPSLVSFDMSNMVSPMMLGGLPGSPIDVNTTGIENYTQEGRQEHPILSRVGDMTRGAKELLFGGQDAGKPMGTSSGVMNNPVTTAMSLAPVGAEAVSSIGSKVEPLARLNKILGVGKGEIRVGGVPTSLDEFAANPARGVLKAGLKENQLARMNPLERLQSLTKVRNDAGEKLDAVLNANPDKTINVQKVVEDVFKQIPDKKMVENATTKLQQILAKNSLTKPLSQLTPMEARTVQRELDEFANFAPEGATKSFRDIATSLRRGISKATRAQIKEVAELDQDYGDLAGAVKASRNQASKYARTVPVSKLRKLAPYIAEGAAAGLGIGGAGAVIRHFWPSP